ncbi:hypothetical protein CERZMDRAFT_119154 [Cercospora zeae-maydis SCOH1-5]|uniref:Rhodopsin domain-containing protein n=1 Tax=Cercospora zeae-maydis SCOH1-5 TaxID=717836 RepID=A0A6A6F005_9PEZI|nr:hypothetical protein CERZMDRAFT_119154 [Cercospora zeae-maydis SCOH1-5]
MSSSLPLGDTVPDERTSLAFVSHQEVLALYAVAGAFLALAMMAVVCRTLTLYLKRTWGQWDDWTMIFSIAPAASMAAFMCVQGGRIAYGPLGEDPMKWLHRIIFDAWMIQISCLTALYAAKLSLCIRYLRIADNADDWFWRLSMVAIVFLTAHYVSSIIVWLTQCLPVAKFWDFTIPGKCVNINAWNMCKQQAVNAISLATDAVVLLLPIRPIWKLRMPIKQRLAIIGIFGLGSLSTVAGCLRLNYLHQFYAGPNDLGQTIILIEIWSYIEITLGIFCGCAPSFRTLLISLRGYIRRTAAWKKMSSPNSTETDTATSRKCSEPSKEASLPTSREPRFEMVQWGGQVSTNNRGQTGSCTSQQRIMEALDTDVQEDDQPTHHDTYQHTGHDKLDV